MHRLVSEEGREQTAAHSEFALARVERIEQAVEHLLEGDTATDVRLWVEEDLRVPHPGRRGAAQVVAGEVGEILRGPQHRHVGVVQIEERLQSVNS